MFLFTRENIDEPQTFFKFIRFIDCIDILQASNLSIIGSAVYEYIWRCSIKCLPWKKFTSLKTLVLDKDIRISNINAISEDRMTEKQIIRLLKSYENLGKTYRKVFTAPWTYEEFVATFKDPICSENFNVSITIGSSNVPTYTDDVDVMESIVALKKNTFVIWKQREYIRAGLEALFKTSLDNFEEPHIQGIINKMGSMIIDNRSIIFVGASFIFSLTSQLKRSVEKGYKLGWIYKGAKFIVPQKTAKELCSICQNQTYCATNSPLVGVVKLPCSHEFHIQCIERWSRQSLNCPLCRTGFSSLIISHLNLD